MTSKPLVETMLFSADDASLADTADRLRRLCNEVASEIVKVARMMEAKPARVHRERMAAELERAAMLFLHAEPYLDRLDTIAAGDMDAAWRTATGAPTALFDRTWPVSGNHA